MFFVLLCILACTTAEKTRIDELGDTETKGQILVNADYGLSFTIGISLGSDTDSLPVHYGCRDTEEGCPDDIGSTVDVLIHTTSSDIVLDYQDWNPTTDSSTTAVGCGSDVCGASSRGVTCKDAKCYGSWEYDGTSRSSQVYSAKFTPTYDFGNPVTVPVMSARATDEIEGTTQPLSPRFRGTLGLGRSDQSVLAEVSPIRQYLVENGYYESITLKLGIFHPKIFLGIDDHELTGMSWMSQKDKTQWTLTGEFTVDHETIADEVDFVVDTSVRDILLEPKLYKKVREQWDIVCENRASIPRRWCLSNHSDFWDGEPFAYSREELKLMPAFTFIILKKHYSIYGYAQDQEVADSRIANNTGYMIRDGNGNKYYLGIKNSGVPGLNVLGTVWIRNWRVTLDYFTNELGIGDRGLVPGTIFPVYAKLLLILFAVLAPTILGGIAIFSGCSDQGDFGDKLQYI